MLDYGLDLNVISGKPYTCIQNVFVHVRMGNLHIALSSNFTRSVLVRYIRGFDSPISFERHNQRHACTCLFDAYMRPLIFISDNIPGIRCHPGFLLKTVHIRIF